MTNLPNVSKDVVTTDLGAELLAYHQATNKAHCLGAAGKAVFLACQDQTAYADLLTELKSQGVADPEGEILATLGVLESESMLDVASDGVDRRRFLQTAAVGMAAPILMSVFAPRPSNAASCLLCDLNGAPNFDPVTCTTCGVQCKFSAAGACTATPVCCFEYRLDDLARFPTSGPLTCKTAEYTAAFGSNYQCRTIPSDRVFNRDCATARESARTRAGALAGDTYYCCSCDGAGPSRSSCP
jgi:hypothetical protein